MENQYKSVVCKFFSTFLFFLLEHSRNGGNLLEISDEKNHHESLVLSFTPTSQRSRRVTKLFWLLDFGKKRSVPQTCKASQKLVVQGISYSFGSLPENIMSIEHTHKKGQSEYIHFLRACPLQPLFLSIYQYLQVLAFERN